MPDDWIILIPEKPGHVPSSEHQQRGLNVFREIAPHAHEIKIELTPEIRFVDCGSNFTKVICPDCEKELPMDWWQDQMNKDFDSGFKLCSIQLPCCSASRNLHELIYEWPQGFAKFSLEAMNPNLGKLPEYHLKTFEAVLDCKLRLIYCHV